MDDVAGAPRGLSSSSIMEFTCKDCQRELDEYRRDLFRAKKRNDRRETDRLAKLVASREGVASRYNEHWAKSVIERGGSRSDRCKDHRAQHKFNIQGMAVAYIDLETVGEVIDRSNPTGPLGGLGPLPDKHTEVEGTSYDLMDANVGMTDDHALQMIELLRDKRVLVLKAGTGTGKSTFAPYRLMDPPPESYKDVPAGTPFAKLTDLGQIVVTEPRVQAARGVAGYVGGVLSGAGGVGPGYPVGYQVSGDRNHDEACQLVYVTDGTMINWLREGRLSRIGTVIVDEAHERSVNIDFIMGYLRRELDRFPHLRVIITSATFDALFYQEYFGGPEVAHIMEVPAVKSFGYGMPLFPELDGIAEGESNVAAGWVDADLPLSGGEHARPVDAFLRQHWREQFAPSLPPDDVLKGHEEDPEDVWDTTRRLLDLRYTGKIDIESWPDEMPDVMAKFVISLAQGLDEAGIFGDILGFLPTTKQIEQVVERVESALGQQYRGHVFPLISTLKPAVQQAALAKRRKGDPRKIVISTNLAETSLTVEGVRFVVDSGVIAQSEWDPNLAQGYVRKKLHSQAGIRQRWGRVGRKAPGWVFPLYTKGQFLSLEQDTPPGSTRENLEALVMTARMGGVDDIPSFPWPAAFEPKVSVLEQRALDAQAIFKTELKRADAALRAGGAVDADGHPTAFGKEVARFSQLGTSNAMALLYADRLACVPEVATVITLLGDNRLVGPDSLLQDTFEWPDEWRLEAAGSHRALAGLAEDEAHLALLIMAAWERADPGVPPWEPSRPRARWAAKWWVNDDVLMAAAIQRQEILAVLSPAMKEQVKRFVEPALLDRTRGVLTRALQSNTYDRDGEVYAPRMPTEGGVAGQPGAEGASPLARLEDRAMIRPSGSVIALRRRTDRLTQETRLSGIIRAAEWALGDGEESAGVADAMRLLVRAAMHAPPDPSRNAALGLIQTWPAGMRAEVRVENSRLVSCSSIVEPFARPESTSGVTRRRARQWNNADEDGSARRSDATGDLKGGRLGEPDEEQAAQAAFQAADRQAQASGACQQCFSCRDGRPEDCDDPRDPTDTGLGGRNPLHGWVARTSKHEAAVGQPVVMGIEDTTAPQWVEVVGLSILDGKPTVTLSPDWRPVGFRGNPAQHADLQPGNPVEVIVGPLLEDHSGPVRSFLRSDERGRFVLREATNGKKEVQESRREIAASLDRGVPGLLDRLVEGRTITATVVPARFQGCLTVTLLELLHQHLAKTVPGVSTVVHKMDRRTSTTLHVARVAETADTWGWVQFALMHHDSVHGIEHRFRHRAGRADDSEAPKTHSAAATESVSGPAVLGLADNGLQIGQVVLLNLVRDSATLNCSELDLDALTRIEHKSAGTLRLVIPQRRSRSSERPKVVGEPPYGGDAGNDGFLHQPDPDEVEEPRIAPVGTEMRTIQDKPLSRAAAAELVGLSVEDDWANDVWSFWARSHHRRLDNRTPFVIPAALPALDERTARMLDVPAAVTIDEEDPSEVIRRRLADFTGRTPVGTSIEVTIDRIVGSGAFVTTAEGLDGFIRCDELSWKEVKDPARFVNAGERIKAHYTGVDEGRDQLAFSYRAAQDAVFQSMKDKLPVGSVIEGKVRATSVNVVYIDLNGGVTGELKLGDLAYEPPSSAKEAVEVGTLMEVSIKRYDDHQRVVELSLKALLPDPYPAFAAAHPEGTVMEVPVKRVGKGVVDLRLAEGVRGFVMARDFAATRAEDLNSLVSVGDFLRVRLTKHHPEKAETQASSHPFDLAEATLQVGQQVEVRVQRATSGAAMVVLDGEVPGVVRRSDFAHEAPSDMTKEVEIGQTLRAEILEVDRGRREVRLSVKKLLPPPYFAFRGTHAVGHRVIGKVTNTIQSFAFVRLPGGVDGSIHVRDLAAHYVAHPDEIVTQGQTVQLVIIGFDDEHRRVRLSLRAAATTAAPAPAGLATQPLRPGVAPIAPSRSAAANSTRSPQPPAHGPERRSASAEGKTVEGAVIAACSKLSLAPHQVRVEVLDDGERGIFGRVKRFAKVRVVEL